MSDPGAPGPLELRLRRALATAMKARDRVAVSALRTTLSAIDNAGAVAAPASAGPLSSGEIAGATSGLGSGDRAWRELSDAQITGIVRAEIDERVTAAGEYVAAGQADEAARLTAEADVLRSHVDR